MDYKNTKHRSVLVNAHEIGDFSLKKNKTNLTQEIKYLQY